MSSIGSLAEKKIKNLFWSLAASRLAPSSPAPVKPVRPLSVLALRPDRLGDFILSVPALKILESRLGLAGEGSRLTLVAGERNAELARFIFPNARVLVFRKSPLLRWPIFARLVLGRFDAVIDFHSYPFSTTSALMALLPGSPLRIGFWDKGESSELSRRVFNGGGPQPLEAMHETQKSLLLTSLLFPGKPQRGGGLILPMVPAEVRRRVDLFFEGLDSGPKVRVLAMHPTLLKKDNRWSPEHFSGLAVKLAKIPRLKIVVVYGRGEEESLEQFLGLLGKAAVVHPLPENGPLFILESLKRCGLFVGGDSGLTHLASLATRVLAVFGPSDPRRWGPLPAGFGKPNILRKKDRQCDSVEVAEVATEIKKILSL